MCNNEWYTSGAGGLSAPDQIVEDGDDGKDGDGHACNASKPSRFGMACMQGILLSRLGWGKKGIRC